MKYLRPLMEKSQSSRSALVIFNRLLRYGIPFNRRHGYRVLNIKPGQVTTLIPYRKCNRNHITAFMHVLLLPWLSLPRGWYYWSLFRLKSID